MLDQHEITREIMWNVPPLMGTLMYVLTAVSTAIAVYGFWRKFQVYRKGVTSKLCFDRPLHRLWRTLKEVFLHTKLNQRQPDGFFHAFVFFGFMALLFVTTMVAIEYDTPLNFFYGNWYLGLSFLAEIGGVALLFGLLYFNVRRFVWRPVYIRATRKGIQSDGWMHFFLTLLVLQGYVLEALRIAYNPKDFDQIVSFVAWPLAMWMKGSLELPTLASWHQGTWIFHMVTTMTWIAMLPFTKFSHLIQSLLNTFTQRLDSKGTLLPIAFDKMENAESFGVGKTKEFSWKQRLSVDTCVECGRCEVACPAFFTQKPLSPKQLVVKLRDRMWAEEKDPTLKDKTVFETNTIGFDELFSCTTCGACMQECPVNIEHVEMIMDMRRHFVMTQGQVPGTTKDMVKKVQNTGNPWGISPDDRMLWAEGLNVPVADPLTKIDYLYYVGCAGAFDDRNKKVARTVVELFQKANVSFAVIGKEEKCNGDPVRRLGDEYAFTEIAVQRVEQLKKYKFDKVVTHCPHCFHTIGAEYKAFDGDFTVIHHSQLLAELLKEGRLKPSKKVEREVVFHDPCYLGRHHGEYDAPRDVLRAVPGLKVVEQERQKEKSFCCGMGGSNMWYEMKHGTSMTQTRMGQLKGASKNIASSCSFCLINFEFGKSTSDQLQDMKVSDISEILKEAME